MLIGVTLQGQGGCPVDMPNKIDNMEVVSPLSNIFREGK
jgi:hypothetical protein